MYTFPEVIREKIDELVSRHPLNRIKAAAQLLTQLYSAKQSSIQQFNSEDLYLAYLAFRMPATYAAISDVCTHLLEERSFSPRSMIDIGSGPGTALFAALSVFDSLQEMQAVERDLQFLRISKEFMKSYLATRTAVTCNWQQADLVEKVSCDRTYDLSVASYCLAEMETSDRKRAIDFLWDSANEYIVVIEPGTVPGYETVMQVRDQLIARGGNVVAPCPHNKPCPLRGNDWCHFSVRLPRTPLHRKLKEAILGYEDEKFSYVIVSKHSTSHTAYSRIIRAPCKRSGHMHVTLCTPDQGVQLKTISRKEKDLYARAKKLEWGDKL